MIIDPRNNYRIDEKSDNRNLNEYEEQAKTSVKTRLTLEAIEKAEKIQPSDEEVDKKLKEMAAMYGKKEDELALNEQFMNYIKDSLKGEAVIKFIVDNAKIK